MDSLGARLGRRGRIGGSWVSHLLLRNTSASISIFYIFPECADFYTVEVETKGARSWWLRLWSLMTSPTDARIRRHTRSWVVHTKAERSSLRSCIASTLSALRVEGTHSTSRKENLRNNVYIHLRRCVESRSIHSKNIMSVQHTTIAHSTSAWVNVEVDRRIRAE